MILPLSFIEELLLLILAQILIGAVIYIVGAKVLKFEMFEYILGIVKERVGKSCPKVLTGNGLYSRENNGLVLD